jgi:hypothetical protein
VLAYTSSTYSERTSKVLREAHWRILLSPHHPYPLPGLRHAVDNGAWTAFQKGESFNSNAFSRLLERHGSSADFVVAPDIVAGGEKSLDFSLSWMPALRHIRRVLLPVQDGMTPDVISPVLNAWPGLGLFLGGSTEWKLQTLYMWGGIAHAFGRHYHVARVNSVRRIRLCAEAGATSFDGSSAAIFSYKVPRFEAGRNQLSLLTPKALSVGH